jgi:predicted MFS family arabinose efflux permease
MTWVGAITRGVAPFARILGTGPAQRVLLGGLVGRFREAGTGLGLVLAVRAGHGSFAVAGLASAVYLVGGAVTRPLHGRWVDRAGPRVSLLWASAANALLLGVVAVLAWRRAPSWVLLVFAAGVGLTLPALSAAMRAMWPRLAPGDIESALALDTFSYELSLIASPALVGLVAVAASPSLSLLIIAALGLAGTSVVALSAPDSHADSVTGRDHPRRLLHTGIVLLIAVSLFVGATEGSLTVLAPGVASLHRDHAASGLLLSAFALGSLLGAVAYGLTGGRGRLPHRLVAGAGGLVISFALLGLLGASITGFAITAALAGAALSPTLTVGFVALRRVAPSGILTEAFTWASFAAASGAAGNQALSGILLAGPGAAAALWLPAATAAAALIAAVGLARSGSLPSR